jgi:ABC-type spermidine/putrescine transport system permease subunit I
MHILSSILFLILSFLLFINSSFAETKTFIKEYTYHAGDEEYARLMPSYCNTT